MTNKTKLAAIISILLWASAYVGIRLGLQEYSPAGLALFRYLIASLCMAVIYFRLPTRDVKSWRDRLTLLSIGAVGIGVYNIALNYGELNIPSGMASFIVSQSPILTALFALMFLGERLNAARIFGFIVSMLGVACIALGQGGGIIFNVSLIYIIIATLASGFFIVAQKPFLKKFHAIEATAYVVWGGTLFLSIFANHLQYDLLHASMQATLLVIYLGIFPAAVGYIAWSYVLNEVTATHAASALYFIPFIATLMGWWLLNEVPMMISLFGGVLAVLGVLLVNRSYRSR